MSDFIARIPIRTLKSAELDKVRTIIPKINSDLDCKYITGSQVYQLEKLGLGSYIEFLNRPIKRTNKMDEQEIIVKYRDEDGKHIAKFKSTEERDTWVAFMESCASAGEQFELL